MTTINEQRKTACLPELKMQAIKERVEGGMISPGKLVHLVEGVSGRRKIGERTAINTDDETNTSKTIHDFTGSDYQVIEVDTKRRIPGESGYVERVAYLVKNDRILMGSRYEETFFTYADNSADWGFSRNSELFLCDEDIVAKSVFEKVKEIN